MATVTSRGQPALLFALVDGLRHDYVDRERAPFLARLAAEGATRAVGPSYGFQQHPALLAGLYPDRSPAGHTMFCFAPEESPFRGLGARLDGWAGQALGSEAAPPPTAALERSLRASVGDRARRAELTAGHTASAIYGSAAHVPLGWLDRFAFAWRRHWYEPDAFGSGSPGAGGRVVGLFDVLRTAGRRWLWLGHPGDDQRTEALLRSYHARVFPGAGLVYIHFGELDWLGHAHGPGAPEVDAALSRIDAALSEIHADLTRRLGGQRPNTLVCGDHGMVAVTRCADVGAILDQGLRTAGLSTPDEVLYFLDSTGARCWAPDAQRRERALDVCREALAGLDCGGLLADSDLTRLHLAYDEAGRHRFGHLLWAADSGVLVLPNFFQAASAVRGMHGYLPEVVDNWTRVIVAGPAVEVARRDPGLALGLAAGDGTACNLVDVFPTALDLLGLPTPGSSQGRSLLASGRLVHGDVDAGQGSEGASRHPSGGGSLPRRAALERGERTDPPAAAARSGPRLTVVIPTYNRASRLQATLQAFERQSVKPTEFGLVVVDDGSTDGTAELLAAWQARWEAEAGRPWLVVVHQRNAGPAAARNAGARAARGDLLLLTGDDCEPHPCLIQEHLAAHARGERVSVLGHVAWHPELEVSPLMDVVMRGAQFCFPAIADPEHVPFTFFYTSNVSVRRLDFEAVGGFDESFRGAAAEDTELGYRLEQSGVRLIYRPRALTYHHHPITLDQFLRRQRLAGREAVRAFRKHPELREHIGVRDVADPQLRERFYTSVLRYAFVLGVEDGLRAEPDAQTGALPGHLRELASLEGTLERWLPGWAALVLDDVTRKEQRITDLEREVELRDQYIASVVQAKDAKVDALEANLQKYHRLPPFRAYFALKRWLERWAKPRS